jgi:hypothetical protein
MAELNASLALMLSEQQPLLTHSTQTLQQQQQ